MSAEVVSADSSPYDIQSEQDKVLHRLSNSLRIAVALLNKTAFTFEWAGSHWDGGRSAFIDGSPTGTKISPREGIVFGGEKKFGLYGVAYMMSYYFKIGTEPYTLDVAFKVAFRGDNWWNVGIVKSHVQATKQRYDDLRLSSFIATNKSAEILLDERRFTVTGKQGTGSHCSLTITIEYNGERQSTESS